MALVLGGKTLLVKCISLELGGVRKAGADWLCQMEAGVALEEEKGQRCVCVVCSGTCAGHVWHLGSMELKYALCI